MNSGSGRTIGQVSQAYALVRSHPVDPSKWQVRYIDLTGRERSKTFRRRFDADKFLILIEAQKQQGSWVNPDESATRLEDWARHWMATRANLKPKTVASYQSLLGVHVLPRFGSVPLDRIQRIQIEAWVADLASKLSPSRTRQAHQVPNALLDSAVQARFLAANPAHRVAPPRAKQREQLFLNPGAGSAAEQSNARSFPSLDACHGLWRSEVGRGGSPSDQANRGPERRDSGGRSDGRNLRSTPLRADQELQGSNGPDSGVSAPG
ncbi:MAG: hypothetical protein ACR2NT_09665 [Acidimicrobiia bacterium]